MSNKRVIGVLKRARNLIAKGWTQGPIRVREGRKVKYCAWGALGYSTGSDNLRDAAVDALSNDPTVKAFVTRRHLYWGDRFANVIRYNEFRGRKQSQVVALFDRTIKRLERQQQA